MCSVFGYSGSVIPEKQLRNAFLKTHTRGPDDMKLVSLENGFLGFQRLAIMGLSPSGMQPFRLKENYLVCNGEIYGFRKIKKQLEEKGYTFESDSDCEILLPLYREYGCKMFEMLDADLLSFCTTGQKKQFIAARDPIGIRPLFYGYDAGGAILLRKRSQKSRSVVQKGNSLPSGTLFRRQQFNLLP